MASSTVRIAAMAELTRAPLKQPADMVIEPPRIGHMRIHISLTELPSNAVTLTVDIVPTNSEVGCVKVHA
jgi:hypothetical protein